LKKLVKRLEERVAERAKVKSDDAGEAVAA
jgi:hypothetical protein